MHSNEAPSAAGITVFMMAWVIAMVHIGIGIYVIERLKERYHQTWISLEKPGVFIGGTKRNAYLLWRFITFGAHRALNDDALNAVCQADIALQIAFMPLFVAAIYFLGKH